MPIRRSLAGRTFSAPPAPITGLIFPSNATPNSNIGLNWGGSDLLPRTGHTAIWRAKFVQQSNYYAVAWHCSNDGTFHADTYEYGCHPYPSNGSFGSGGEQTNNGDFTDHYFEIAGLGANDFIASNVSPGPQSTFHVVKGVWYSQARTCEVISGTTLRHTFWPDVDNNPTLFIRQEITLASLATPTSPIFRFGTSPWTVVNTNQNNETPSATLRGFRLFNAALVIADIQTEVAAIGSNAAASTAGQAAVWYINDNPTPSDVTAKAGSHAPAWATAERPTLFTG